MPISENENSSLLRSRLIETIHLLTHQGTMMREEIQTGMSIYLNALRESHKTLKELGNSGADALDIKDFNNQIHGKVCHELTVN